MLNNEVGRGAVKNAETAQQLTVILALFDSLNGSDQLVDRANLAPYRPDGVVHRAEMFLALGFDLAQKLHTVGRDVLFQRLHFASDRLPHRLQ